MFGRSTGNDIRGHYKQHFFPFLFLLRHLLFSKKECSNQKTFLAKVDGSAQKPIGRHLSIFHFGAPWHPFGFCRRCGVVRGEQVAPAPLFLDIFFLKYGPHRGSSQSVALSTTVSDYYKATDRWTGGKTDRQDKILSQGDALTKKECIDTIVGKSYVGDWFLFYLLGQNIDSVTFFFIRTSKNQLNLKCS